jgi:thiamine phosphate synthase YjbQ (UPF0047 family)
MRIETTRLTVVTDDGVSIADITSDVNAFVRATGIEQGLCVMTIPREACFLSLAPDLDEAFDDLLRLARDSRSNSAGAGPHAGEPAAASPHPVADPDSSSSAGVLAECLSFAVRGGAVQIGNWDAVVLVDTAGPVARAIDITLMGAASD